MNIIKDGERLDDLHRNGYMIIQNPNKFCFGIDAVLLSDFARAKKGASVIDIGTGTGIIPILMCAKTNASKYIGIDIQEESVDMAKRSVLINKLDDKIEILHLDVKNAENNLKKGSFDVVTSNPPYMNIGGGLLNEYDSKKIARHEILCTLDDVVKTTSSLLRSKGEFYMVHRPSRLCDIITTFRKYKLEPKIIKLVQPYKHKEPNILLIKGVKDGNAMLTFLPNLVVYEDDGKYTKEINDIHYN